ncbi:alpha/beta fold hydrolase [Acuticoccus sp. MNP-M23]|uniref:alpha/beta fold hydrolase n=1 Tax=Acuticoccus sp. MNP-M23 TaxID=3072793 RepID=UPI002814BDA7|nr:alpha/beta fold hydrolase [Acuticoccus sp. MNP-M23]WMS41296.1 alpha/beta fold hydrolase [Acuticoccus sp. MNP-M23]
MTRADWGSTDLGGTIGTLHAGAKLRVAHWPGAADGPGTVVLVQGRGEFIEMYSETIADLNDRGFAVIAFDFRGQGGSARRVRTGGHIDSYRHYVEDLCAVVRHAAQLGLPRPYTLLAHSMGGLVATLATPVLASEVDRVVSVAPLFRIARLPMPSGMVAALSWIGARVGLSRTLVTKARPLPDMTTFADNRITSDPARYSAFCKLAADNPGLMIGPPTFGWLSATFRAMGQARRMQNGLLPVPSLFIACGADRVVSPVAIDVFARNVKGGGIVIMRHARHQLLLERDHLRNLFFAAFDAFVTNQPADAKRKKARRAGRGLKFVVGRTGNPVPPRASLPQSGDELPLAPLPQAEPAATVAAIDPQPAVQAAPDTGDADAAAEDIGDTSVAGRFDNLRERIEAGRKHTAQLSRVDAETGAGTAEAEPTVPGPLRTRIAPPRPVKRGRGAKPARRR